MDESYILYVEHKEQDTKEIYTAYFLTHEILEKAKNNEIWKI